MAEYYVQQNSPEERARIARFISRALTATFAGALVFAAFILAARWWAPMIPFSAEKRFADRYVGFFVDRMEPGDPVLMDYVTDLAKDLSEQMKMPAEFEVVVHYVDDPEPVAFATLGGHVFVFKGILESLETENALAMVLAHELAHLANRDAIISTGRAVLFSILLFSATGRDNWSTRTADTATELCALALWPGARTNRGSDRTWGAAGPLRHRERCHYLFRASASVVSRKYMDIMTGIEYVAPHPLGGGRSHGPGTSVEAARGQWEHP